MSNLEQEFEEIWTTQDISDYLKIDRKKVYELYKIPTFPVIKLGRDYRVPKILFFKWLKNYNKILNM